MRWKVRARMYSGERINTTKYWATKEGAQKYADQTNKYRPGARARVIKVKKL